jgi:radical SAM-linked protein
MARKQPPGAPPPPAVQKLRLRYTKRGRLRFTSHRDIARAFERALRRAQVPMAYSAGFSPHPKISWVGAAPTGVASEAEYVEISVAERVDLAKLQAALDESLPAGIDVVDVVEAVPGSGQGTNLPDRVEASSWGIRLPQVPLETLHRAVGAFLTAESVPVTRLMKDGVRQLDARAPVVSMRASWDELGDSCATLLMVVRHVTPAVRPDDVLSGLRSVADLVPPVPPEATRYAQGPLTETGEVGDPLAPDRLPADGATRAAADLEQAVAGAP